MIQWEVIRHQVAIGGRVTDSQTGRSLDRAQVRFTSAPAALADKLSILAKMYGTRWASMLERPDQTWTAADGHFHFLDLPSGAYTLVATLPEAGSRYGTVQTTVTVSRDSSGNVVMATANIQLPPTAVEGKTTRQDATPVVMAEVRVKGSGERVFTDSQGQYQLSAVEIGTRTIQVSVQGFRPTSQVVSLTRPGATRTLNFTLVPTT